MPKKKGSAGQDLRQSRLTNFFVPSTSAMWGFPPGFGQPQGGGFMMQPQGSFMMPQQAGMMPQGGQPAMMMPPQGFMMQPQGNFMMPQQVGMMPQGGQVMMTPQGFMMMAPQAGQQMPPQGGNAAPFGGGAASGNMVGTQQQSVASDSSLPEGARFADDHRKISTTYKFLGQQHLNGDRATPKKFRASLCCACDPGEYPLVRVVQLTEEAVDMLVFVLSGVLPNTKVCDLGCTTKAEARAAIRSQYMVKMAKNRSRLSGLSEELGNIATIALRLGYPTNLFSPELRACYERMRNSAGSQMHRCDEVEALADGGSAPALADGKVDGLQSPPLGGRKRGAAEEPAREESSGPDQDFVFTKI